MDYEDLNLLCQKQLEEIQRLNSIHESLNSENERLKAIVEKAARD